ncbi:MAG: hypothetical protein RMJ98_01045 [Myxococcales bacterium]|nr:hypothetical protein [Polyangiaceae bacterium]MDW8247873.1 hypothetical protein [Myxococcales bacterium]
MDARQTIVLGTAWLLAACEVTTPAPSRPSPATSASGSSISFLEDAPLVLTPGQRAELIVQLSPPHEEQVRFGLLGDTAGAALSTSKGFADTQGRASVWLRGPRQATTFHVQASLESGVSSTRQVKVLLSSTSSVLVGALYHGNRPTPQWEAALLDSDAPCSASAPPLLKQLGVLPLHLEGLPSGQTLRLRLKAGKLVLGCTMLPPLQAGEEHSTQILVKNTPPSGLRPLDLRLQLSPEPSSWSKLLTAWRHRFLDAFLGGGNNKLQEATALLDTMMVLASSQQRLELLLARKSAAWDDLLAQRFATLGGPEITRSWLSNAHHALLKAQAPLEGQLTSEPTQGTTFLPSRFLTLPAPALATNKPASWKLDEGDILLASGELRFSPSVLLRQTTEQQLAAYGEEPVARLQEVTDCGAVGQLLASATSLEGCKAPCLTSLCNAALSTMWLRASTVDDLIDTSATLSFTASGAASLDPQARVVGFSGSWIGQLRDPLVLDVAVTFQGEATGLGAP